jgi:predicted TIM-barrel fold metal-dependent hydrolase
MTRPARIDTHAHVLPQRYREHLSKNGHAHPDGMPAIPEWSSVDHIATMDKNKISKAYLSVSSPGTHLVFGEHELAHKVTREANEDVAKVVAEHPDRFGFFASLPLPDVEGSLAEIDYALDVLKADGFVVLTNCHGVYLGDDAIDRVFAKLNERKAILFMHPTQCCINQGGVRSRITPQSQYPLPMLEFFFDTTRAVTNLILSRTVERYTDIKFLVGHCGATLPSVVERFTGFATTILGSKDGGAPITSDLVKHLFQTRFHFDLAGFPFPDQVHGLLRMTDHTRLLYGSDYPYSPGPAVDRLSAIMEEEIGKVFDEDQIADIYKNNGEKLLS